MIPQSSFAYYTENWEIKNFHSEISINSDGKVEITENILADFTNEAHKGLGRSIPYKYTGLETVNAKLDFVSATNEKGFSWNNDIYRENGYLNIDMYEPTGKMLNSEAIFIPKYTAKKVIGFFEEHDEFYWNVNGTEWVVPIQKLTAKISLPKSFSKDKLKTTCYTGGYGSTEQNCKISFPDNQTVNFETTKPLSPYENLTIVIGMPKGTITPPSTFSKIIDFLLNNFGIFFAILTLIGMFVIWHNYGRDDQEVSNTIMPHYTPPKDLSPAETGTLMDEKLDPRDITSTIIDFAIKGFLRINELEKKGIIFKNEDYELELIKEYPETVKPFEKLILSAIFPTNQAGQKTKLSDLKNKFYAHLQKIEKSIMGQLINDDHFPHNPSTVRKFYATIGGIVLALPIFFGEILVLVLNMSVISTVGFGAAGLIIIIFGMKMPRKSKKGTQTYYHLKGLYEYIDTAEKDRMHFQEEQSIMFEKLLPYAMAFGLIKKWTKVFDGLIKNPPSWYHTNRTWGNNGFTMVYFADKLSSIGDKFSQNITSRPGGKGGGGAWSGGSGFGGGFSGGGFGGGGGRGL